MLFRSGRVIVARAPILLCVAAAVPFIPAAWQFIQHGVPDVLFTGDGATLEIRMLHAAHGEQLVGPYSRFLWSHPGPTFFYLALPIYEAFGQRGPALNLFMFIVNLMGTAALVLSARWLRGDLFALAVAALLAVYELVGEPFVQTGEWNPVAPMLPFALLSFLAARLALGGMTVLPAFVLVASTIVQTHIAYLPEVFALSTLVLLAAVGRRFGVGVSTSRSRRTDAWILAATAGVLILCWMLPLYEAATEHPGNLQMLFAFFAAPHPQHPLSVAVDTVFDQMAVMPLALARTFRIAVDPTRRLLVQGLAIGQLIALVAALGVAVRRRDAGLAMLAIIAVGEVIVAIATVRAIRGEILPYLVVWTSLLGFMSCAALAAWLVPALQEALGRARGAAVVVAGAILVLAFAVSGPVPTTPAFRPADVAAQQFASDVENYLLRAHVARPVIRIASDDRFETWPTAMAVVLHLSKRAVPIYVEPEWIFMAGKPFAPDEGEHPGLIFGGRSFDGVARTRRDLTYVAASRGVYAYVEEAGYLRHHWIAPGSTSPAAFEVQGDPRRVVDGVLPAEGAPWNSALSLILTSAASSLVVELPRADVVGLFLSADGNDLYRIGCVDRQALSWSVGVSRPEDGSVGMRTRLLFSEALASCRAIEVTPGAGDGSYAIGEIGFLRR